LCVFEIVRKKELWSTVSKTIIFSLFVFFSFILCCSFSDSNHFSLQHSIINNYFPFLPFLQLCGGNTHPHTLFLNQSQHNPLAPSFSLRTNMVFFFLRFNNMLKTRKRGLSSRGYQWINVMVSLFGQVAKTRNASVISNHACSPKMQNNRIKLNI